MRTMLGSVLITIGVLATMVVPARARHGAGPGPNRPLVPRATSRLVATREPNAPPSRVDEALEYEVAIPPLGWLDGSARGRSGASQEGLQAAVEPRMRRLVADQLGVDVEELVPEVSLTDELAADSLDLLELTLVIESEFAIAVPERRINEIRTYRDLVDTVLMSLDGRQRGELMRSHPLTARSRVVPAGAGASGSPERADVLTPYALQIIGEDAAHAGRGGHLDLTVSTSAEDGDLAAIRGELAWLERRGVGVSVRRDTGGAGGPVGGMLVQEE